MSENSEEVIDDLISDADNDDDKNDDDGDSGELITDDESSRSGKSESSSSYESLSSGSSSSSSSSGEGTGEKNIQDAKSDDGDDNDNDDESSSSTGSLDSGMSEEESEEESVATSNSEDDNVVDNQEEVEEVVSEAGEHQKDTGQVSEDAKSIERSESSKIGDDDNSFNSHGSGDSGGSGAAEEGNLAKEKAITDDVVDHGESSLNSEMSEEERIAGDDQEEEHVAPKADKHEDTSQCSDDAKSIGRSNPSSIKIEDDGNSIANNGSNDNSVEEDNVENDDADGMSAKDGGLKDGSKSSRSEQSDGESFSDSEQRPNNDENSDSVSYYVGKEEGLHSIASAQDSDISETVHSPDAVQSSSQSSLGEGNSPSVGEGPDSKQLTGQEDTGSVNNTAKNIETPANSLEGGSAFTTLTSIDGSSTFPLNRDDDQSNVKTETTEKLAEMRGAETKLALEGLDELGESSQSKTKSCDSSPIKATSADAETSKGMEDDNIGDTSQLTPMEKLKLAAKYGSEKNIDKAQFINLLESSIRDLESMDLQAEGSQVEDDAKRSALAYAAMTPETYASKPSRSDSRRTNDSRPSRSNSRRSKRNDSRRKHRHRSHRHSRSPRDEEKTDTQKEWELYLQRNNAPKGATVPQAVKDVLACIKKSDPLPRESVVSSVVRELVTMRINHEETKGCVAIMGQSGEEGGIGKSTIAALVCNRGDILTRYQGVSWVNLGPASLDFERYSKILSDICRQIGVKPHHLKLSPFVRTPAEDPVVANLRMKAHMEEARYHMGKLVTSVQRKRWKSCHKSLLVVLDDVTDEADIGWFQFHRGGEGDKLNDILVTSRLSQIDGAIIVTVPPLTSRESANLFLSEADLPKNHRIANTPILKDFLKTCHHHPLTIRFAGRWLNLKRATAGGNKGTDEILVEIKAATTDVAGSSSHLDVLHAMMLKAMSPLVKGVETKIIRLCFAAFVTVFCKESYSVSIPVEVVTEFFLKVVENESAVLSNEDPLFKSHGRRSSALVPEILGALGVFSITKHSTIGTDSEKKESSIRIDHVVIHRFSEQIFADMDMQHFVRHSEQRWNEAYVQSYLQSKSNLLWDELKPDRSRKYALDKAPTHMIQAEMYDDVESLLRNESFIRGRFWYMGWTEGTRAHVTDVERFWEMAQYEKDESDVIATFEQLESVLMEEVARESGGPNGRCTTLEAGRCLHEISLSLAKIGLFQQATKFCNTCIKLVESNLGPSELVAALLYNSSMIYVEANEFAIAEEKISECMKIRTQTSGQENILYVRSLCLMGDILSTMSEYATSQACFDKAIGILKIIPPRYHLDFGNVLYKLGRNQHRRGGYLDDAFQCYEEALEFEKVVLGNSHSFIASLLTKKGEILLENDDVEQAIQNFNDALKVLNDALAAAGDDSTSSYLRSKVLILEGLLLSVSAESNKCIVKYKQGLKLLKKFVPNKKIKMAELTYLVGSEFEKQGDYKAADKVYNERIELVKEVLGPTHLDIAETLVNLSGVKSALGDDVQATSCLEDAIDLQRTRLGDCEEVAITLTILGAHLKAIGEYKKAEQAYAEAIRILRLSGDDTDSSLVDALLGMADLLNSMTEYDQANGCYIECLEIQKKLFGKSHDDIASTLYAMGLTKNNQKLYSRALTFFQKALDIRVEIYGEADSSVRDTHSIMGFTEAANGELDNAIRKLGDALRVSQLLSNRIMEAETLSNIGNVHREKEEWELALEHYDSCMSIRIAELGNDDESVADVLMAIGNVQSDMSKHEEAVKSYKDGESS